MSGNTCIVCQSIRRNEPLLKFYRIPPDLNKRALWLRVLHLISRNGPYIGGHLAFYFKLNFKQGYNVLLIGLIMLYVLRKIIPLTIL